MNATDFIPYANADHCYDQGGDRLHTPWCDLGDEQCREREDAKVEQADAIRLVARRVGLLAEGFEKADNLIDMTLGDLQRIRFAIEQAERDLDGSPKP